MKYKKRIIKRAFNGFPFDKIVELKGGTIDEYRKDMARLISPHIHEKVREGIFIQNGEWKIKIHYEIEYVKISYFPNYPSKKQRIFYSYYERDRET